MKASQRCARCGALKQDHMDYGRGKLVCPSTEPGVFTERQQAASTTKRKKKRSKS